MFENLDLAISGALFLAGLWIVGPLSLWVLLIQAISFSSARKSHKQSKQL